MKWIDKLERRFRKFYIPNLTKIFVGGMVAVFVVHLVMTPINPFFVNYLGLIREPILRGEIWRIVTFIFMPPTLTVDLFTFFSFYFIYFIGSSLEQRWTGFRFTLYFLLGVLCAIIAMFITGVGSNYYLQLSFFLAFATLMPDFEFMLFFVLPVKAKWFALLYIGFLAYGIYIGFMSSMQNGLSSLVSAALSLLPYFLFFGPTLVARAKDQYFIYNNRRRWNKRNK